MNHKHLVEARLSRMEIGNGLFHRGGQSILSHSAKPGFIKSGVQLTGRF